MGPVASSSRDDSLHLSKKRPEWPEQVKTPEELEVGELYEMWHNNKLLDIVQIAGKPEKDNIGLKISVLSFLFQTSDLILDPENYIYLEDKSIIPYERGFWNIYNHMKKHPSRAYKELAKKD